MKIAIAKAFTLNRDDGTSVTYKPGLIDMPDADAKHWFTGLHTETEKAVEDVKPGKGGK